MEQAAQQMTEEALLSTPLEELAGLEVETPEPDAPQAEEVVADEPAQEVVVEDVAAKEAKLYGWKTREEWKGEGWIPAEQFLEQRKQSFGSEITSLKSANDKLQKGVEALLAHQQRQLEIARQEAYQRAMSDIEYRLANAVQNQNSSEVQQLLQIRDNITRADEAGKYAMQPVNGGTNDDALVDKFKRENTWFEQDEDMTVYARGYEDRLAQQGVPLEKRLQMTVEKTKQVFANKFRQPTTPNMTMATQTRQVASKPKDSYEGLPAEWRKECDKYVESVALYMKPADARKEYIATLKAGNYI